MTPSDYQERLMLYPDLARFDQLIQEHIQSGFFNLSDRVFINRTPGRLDLMGGNDDYTGGLVFEKTIREATFAAVQPRQDRQVRFSNPAVRDLGWSDLVVFTLDDLLAGDKLKNLPQMRDWVNSDPRRSWCAYIIGDLYLLMQRFPEKITHGFDLLITSDVPLGKGVSSSAALEVAPMKAMAAMYVIPAGGVELAAWTQWVEIALTQSACGIMDQVAVILGDEDVFVPMICQPSQVLTRVKMPGNLLVWGIDSGVKHAVSGIEYEAARAATFMGYRHLCSLENLQPVLDESGALPRWVEPRWNGYLANLTPSFFRERYEKNLPEVESGADFNRLFATHLDPFTPVRPEVNYPVRGATRYAVEENARVRAFYSILVNAADKIENISAQALGELMYLAHHGYTECGLGSEETDLLVSLVRAEEAGGLLGAKITGGGAGGTVAVLAWNTPAARSAFQRVVERYQQQTGIDPYIFEGSSAGCDTFGVLMRERSS